MISIDLKSRVPIYEQIITEFKNLILAGALLPDEKIPSVRQLSGTLAINPNTIQKAYIELERQKLIYSIAGRGSFISANSSSLEGEKRQETLLALRTSLHDAKKYGITRESVTDIFNEVFGAPTDTHQ